VAQTRNDLVKLYVAVTDNDWFQFLRARPDLDEVNFWQPSGSREFRLLAPGAPFLFKLHSPQNFIVGGGFFVHFSIYPSSLAWEAFGEKNGAASLVQMRTRIEKYRKGGTGFGLDSRSDYKVGCIILQDPFFFDERDWIETPEDFHRNIVQGKSYDLASGTGKALWDAVDLRLHRGQVRPLRVSDVERPVYGNPAIVRQRLGQGAFRVLVTDTYKRRCAITQEKALPTLEAAHVRPVSEGGLHRVDNGLLLRSDVHRLFDAGYITVAPDYRVRVSRRLQDDFQNGEQYLRLNGSSIWVPAGQADRPNREYLEWHADTVYCG
jgi:putative restriction endonuclease